MKIIPFYRDDIVSYLRSHDRPVMEADMLKNLTELKSLPSKNDELFLYHFSLYHAMYSLKKQLAREGLYLHIDTMRISLTPYPPEGRCFHFNPEMGSFCSRPCSGNYCPNHLHIYQHDKDNLYYDYMHDFYINEDNISFGESELLAKLMNGIIVYAFHKGEIEDALQFFDLTHPNKKIIQNKYHKLAMKYHPDRNNGDDSKMKKLNHSYQVLREVYIL